MGQTVKTLTQDQERLFDETNFAHLATVMPDGSPQVTPVWIDMEDGYIRVNTAEGRVKDRNVRRDPRVAISILDPTDAYTSTLSPRSTWGTTTTSSGSPVSDA